MINVNRENVRDFYVPGPTECNLVNIEYFIVANIATLI
jgi:hypothetical protein